MASAASGARPRLVWRITPLALTTGWRENCPFASVAATISRSIWSRETSATFPLTIPRRRVCNSSRVVSSSNPRPKRVSKGRNPGRAKSSSTEGISRSKSRRLSSCLEPVWGGIARGCEGSMLSSRSVRGVRRLWPEVADMTPRQTFESRPRNIQAHFNTEANRRSTSRPSILQFFRIRSVVPSSNEPVEQAFSSRSFEAISSGAIMKGEFIGRHNASSDFSSPQTWNFESKYCSKMSVSSPGQPSPLQTPIHLGYEHEHPSDRARHASLLAGRWSGRAAVSAYPRPRQASRAFRRHLPNHRYHPLELY